MATGYDLTPHREALDVDTKARAVRNRLLHIRRHVLKMQTEDPEVAGRISEKPKKCAKRKRTDEDAELMVSP